jgi:hypothetical protein
VAVSFGQDAPKKTSKKSKKGKKKSTTPKKDGAAH